MLKIKQMVNNIQIKLSKKLFLTDWESVSHSFDFSYKEPYLSRTYLSAHIKIYESLLISIFPNFCPDKEH